MLEVIEHWIKRRLNELEVRNKIQLLEVIYKDEERMKKWLKEDTESTSSSEPDNSEERIRKR